MRRLPETSSHNNLQKVRNFGVGFTGLQNGTPTVQKILLILWIVKGKINFGNSLGSKTKIDDLRLKCGILRGNPKNKSSGSTSHSREKIDPSPQI